jgi:hypothetical protein
MGKWNCFDKGGKFLGVVDAETEEEAVGLARDRDGLPVEHAEEREEVPRESGR